MASVGCGVVVGHLDLGRALVHLLTANWEGRLARRNGLGGVGRVHLTCGQGEAIRIRLEDYILKLAGQYSHSWLMVKDDAQPCHPNLS